MMNLEEFKKDLEEKVKAMSDEEWEAAFLEKPNNKMNKTIKNVKLRVEVDISPESIVDDFTRDEAMDFICAVDLIQADAGFTEELIIKLIKSMKSDLFPDEWESFKALINSTMS
jgi:hypothetical protein